MPSSISHPSCADWSSMIETKRNLLAETLTSYMKENKVTLTELSKRLSMDRETVTALSRGTKEFRVQTLQALARFFEWGPADVGSMAMNSEVLPRKKSARRKRG